MASKMTYKRYRSFLETITELSLGYVALNQPEIKKNDGLYVYLYNQLLTKLSLQTDEENSLAFDRAYFLAKRNKISIMKEKEFVENNFVRCSLGIREVNQPKRDECGYVGRKKGYDPSQFPF